MPTTRYLIAFFLFIVLAFAAMTGYASYRAEKSFDTDIKKITTKYPNLHISNYQYHKGLLSSDSNFELILGCENDSNDKQVRLKIDNKISHFPISLHGLRSAHIETTVLPNDATTKKIAEQAHLTHLATAQTDVQLDGGYDSNIKIPSGNITNDTSKAKFHWQEISYQINKQSSTSPNYSTHLTVPKVALTGDDATANIKVELQNLSSKSDSEQTEQQFFPTKLDSNTTIEKISFNLQNIKDNQNDVNLQLNNYHETSELRSQNGLLNIKSNTKLTADLNKLHFDNIEMQTDLNNFQYDAVNKIFEAFSKNFNQCQADRQSTQNLMKNLFASFGELAKHQPNYHFKMNLSESGNKAAFETTQQLQNIFAMIADMQKSKPDMNKIMDGNHTTLAIPKVWMSNFKAWLDKSDKSQVANSYNDFEKTLIEQNYIKDQNGQYQTDIKLKQGDIYIFDKKVDKTQSAPTASARSSVDFMSETAQQNTRDSNFQLDQSSVIDDENFATANDVDSAELEKLLRESKHTSAAN